MIKAKCIYVSFTIDGCQLTIDKAWSPEIIKSTFKGCLDLGIGDPSDGDPDMVLAKRMFGYFPVTGEIVEYKPPKLDPTVIY